MHLIVVLFCIIPSICIVLYCYYRIKGDQRLIIKTIVQSQDSLESNQQPSGKTFWVITKNKHISWLKNSPTNILFHISFFTFAWKAENEAMCPRQWNKPNTHIKSTLTNMYVYKHIFFYWYVGFSRDGWQLGKQTVKTSIENSV